MVREQLKHGFSGWLMLGVSLAILVAAPVGTFLNWAPRRPPLELVVALPILILLAKGFFKVAPNQGVVLQLFGNYAGTAKMPGLRWANPFYGMVEMALTMLSGKGIVHLDEERKAAMVSNLLVVLCGERGAQPIVNTGTIYQ